MLDEYTRSYGQVIGQLARLTSEEADDVNSMTQEVNIQLKTEGAYTWGTFKLLSEATAWLRPLIADLEMRT